MRADKLTLLTRDTAEIVTKEQLADLLEQKRELISYWGVAPTGPPHIGYYRALAKQFDLITAGCKHKVLIANLHAYLDDMKCPWEQIHIRAQIYQKCFELLGLKGPNVQYVLGTDFQLKEDYVLETFKASALVTASRATRAASEVVRMTNPKVSSLIYPIMQVLDCWALDVDIALAGIDNRHVYMLGRELLPKLGHKSPVCIFTPLGLSLTGGKKMSASEKGGRLELFAPEDQIRQKISAAFCPAKQVEGNPILELAKFLIFPRIKKFKITRPEKYGGDVELENFDQLAAAYSAGQIHPADLKSAVAQYLIQILAPVREYFEKNQDLLEVF